MTTDIAPGPRCIRCGYLIRRGLIGWHHHPHQPVDNHRARPTPITLDEATDNLAGALAELRTETLDAARRLFTRIGLLR